jgi:hypothetical protein
MGFFLHSILSLCPHLRITRAKMCRRLALPPRNPRGRWERPLHLPPCAKHARRHKLNPSPPHLHVTPQRCVDDWLCPLATLAVAGRCTRPLHLPPCTKHALHHNQNLSPTHLLVMLQRCVDVELASSRPSRSLADARVLCISLPTRSTPFLTNQPPHLHIYP